MYGVKADQGNNSWKIGENVDIANAITTVRGRHECRRFIQSHRMTTHERQIKGREDICTKYDNIESSSRYCEIIVFLFLNYMHKYKRADEKTKNHDRASMLFFVWPRVVCV